MVVQKLAYSKDVAMAFDELKNESALPKWGRDVENLNRRNVFLGELRCVTAASITSITTLPVRYCCCV